MLAAAATIGATALTACGGAAPTSLEVTYVVDGVEHAETVTFESGTRCTQTQGFTLLGLADRDPDPEVPAELVAQHDPSGELRDLLEVHVGESGWFLSGEPLQIVDGAIVLDSVAGTLREDADHLSPVIDRAATISGELRCDSTRELG